jgi:hypothetical protein
MQRWNSKGYYAAATISKTTRDERRPDRVAIDSVSAVRLTL